MKKALAVLLVILLASTQFFSKVKEIFE